MADIQKIGPGNIDIAVDVLCEAFDEYPVMQYVLGDTSDYELKYRTLIHFFVMNRVLKDEHIFGVVADGEIQAVATTSISYKEYDIPELVTLSEQVWDLLGEKAKQRYTSFGAVCNEHLAKVPHWHVNMIGVRKKYQGKGFARILMDLIHLFSQEDLNSEGVTLTTEVPGNVSFYEHLGYHVTGHGMVGGAFTSWSFFRKDQE